jgi:hypothetical protein
MNVAQLNQMARYFNDTAKVLTQDPRTGQSLFGVNRRKIVIADSEFNHPDSIARFAYSNMYAVPQSIAPIDIETRRNYIIVRDAPGSGGNAPFFQTDNLTIRGASILLPRGLTHDAIYQKINEEAGSALLGSVESSIHYASLYDEFFTYLTPQDFRRQQFIIFLGPGAKFPALNKDYTPPQSNL